MKLPIVLIGPVSTGKTTLGKLLAVRLNLLQASFDDLRWDYYKEAGFDQARADEIRQKGGFLALVWYWKQFDAHAVERLIAEHTNAVIDFGAGASIYENKADMARVEKALAKCQVILILPSSDPAESISILHERTKHLVGTFAQDFDWHDYFVRHPGNYKLAKFTVYTKNKTPEHTADEILMRLT
jgi:shikimate kinase